MNVRNWAIAAGLLLVALGSALYEGKIYLENKRRLESLVVQAVSPYINGTLTVGKVRFGFFSAHLRTISLLLPAQSCSVTVDEIKVELSLIKLLRSGFTITRSIRRIVLVGPSLELSLAPLARSTAVGADTGDVRPPPVAAMRRELSVKYLFVKRGTIRIRDRSGTATLLGEQLEGRMWDTGKDLNYELSGRLGAARKNIFVSGRISWCGEKHRLSLKLNSAEVRRPLSFRGIAVTGGILSGALEMALSDSSSNEVFESNGWIRIRGGTCRLSAIKKPFDSVAISLSINDSRCTLDSASGRFSSVHLRARGIWDLLGRTAADRIEFEARNIWLDSLGLPFPIDLCRRVAGAGWLCGNIARRPGSDVEMSLSGGGVAVMGTPVTGVSGKVFFQNKQLSFDSLSLQSPACKIDGSGTLDYSNAPVGYTFQCTGVFDSLAVLHPQLDGTARLTGVLSGMGKEMNSQLSLQAKALRLDKVPFGRVSCDLQARGDSVTFEGRGDERTNGCKFSGILRRLFSDHPNAECALDIRTLAANPVFKNVPLKMLRPDSLRLSAFFDGWTDTFALHMKTDVFSKNIQGALSWSCNRNRGPRRPVVWKLEQHNLMICGERSALAGAGQWYHDSLVIDSLVFLDRVAAAGTIIFVKPARMQGTCRYDLPVKRILKIAGESGEAVETGQVSGVVRFAGPVDKIESRAEVHLKDLAIGGVGGLATDVVVAVAGENFIAQPFVVRKDDRVVAAVDTVTNAPHLRLSGRLENLDLRALCGQLIPEEVTMEGAITGTFRSSENGLPITINLASARITIDEWQFDSVRVVGTVDSSGVMVQSLRAVDRARTIVSGNGYVPLSILKGSESEGDTMQAVLSARGDLIATLHNVAPWVIDGTGKGALTLSVYGMPDNWYVSEASILIPAGTLIAKPYIAEPVKGFSCVMTMNTAPLVTTVINGTVGKRSVRIFSTHDVPDGYEPITIGPLDLGILQIETPQHGLDLHLPGFMEPGETGDLEPAGKPPLNYFSLAGPLENPKVAGTLLLRDVEFTYPLLEGSETFRRTTKEAGGEPSSSSPASLLSRICWDLDIKAADRKVYYFRDIAGGKTRFIRFLDAAIDQGMSIFRIRGCDSDKSLKISGTIKSFRGAVYYGKTFDRNFEATLEFVPEKYAKEEGYNNFPFLSGNAEAFSDTSRADRIKLTALVQDQKTGALSERGRLGGKHLNVVFRLSSDFEELPGDSERDFYRQAGLQFTTLGGAGRFVSDFGEQNLNRILLQRIERKIARSIGLDVINIETSIASNYFTKFYNRQIDNMMTQADYLAFANVGVTVGRYFFRDNLFLKARGGLIPVDTALTPEYSVGFEFQPMRYLFIEGDWGLYKTQLAIEHNPRFNVHLELPIKNVRNFFDF